MSTTPSWQVIDVVATEGFVYFPTAFTFFLLSLLLTSICILSVIREGISFYWKRFKVYSCFGIQIDAMVLTLVLMHIISGG
jgi:hypothetical protein